MARTRTTTPYRCRECGAGAPQWSGRCTQCGEWNTLAEGPGPGGAVGGGDAAPMPVTHVDLRAEAAAATGVPELDRVLGGGLVPGSVTLLGGEPGIGKSTLLLQVAAAVARSGRRVLLVSAEESRAQVRGRAERLDALEPELWLAAETDVARIVAAAGEVEPHLLVVDSIQTIRAAEHDSGAGSVTQVRECAATLTQLAKARGFAVVLVGHVTKEGNLAGPRVLEHLVDTVLSFEGDRFHSLRLLRAVKHRFGPTGELGLFEMGEAGLAGVPDASAVLLADRQPGVAGSVVVPVAEGHRILLVEMQALVVPGRNEVNPRRAALGVDGGRLALALAVLQQRAGLARLGSSEVFASAVGGVRVVEPAADLGLALAIASAVNGRSLPPDLVAVGEVGLAGEVRQVSGMARRLAEAERLGFRQALVPAATTDAPPGLRLRPVATVAETLAKPWAWRR